MGTSTIQVLTGLPARSEINSKYSRGGEQFVNSSRVQFVISSRTVPEWGMNMKGEGLEFEFSSSSRCLGSFFLRRGGNSS